VSPARRTAGARHDEGVTAALDDLLAILDLEAIELNIFRGFSPGGDRIRVFGGQVAGQALVAAGRTVDALEGPPRLVHSLHAYFLRPGDPQIPILYEVDRIRDGRSFATRRVTAIQRGEAIFSLSASFHVHEEGVNHQAPMPDAPDPETLPDWQARMAANGDQKSADRPHAIDIRPVDEPIRIHPDQAVRAPRYRVWFRADGKLPDDSLVHACVVAYASDMTLLDTTMLPHGLIWEEAGKGTQASLDHAMWFHRPFRADDWLLYDQQSPSASGARGLATGTIFTRDGTLVVSVVQEGLIRTFRQQRV
jgi:acyl-CoA thioesterase-2